MEDPPTEQLSAADASFLVMESPTVHMHTGALNVLDPSEAPEFDFEKLKQVVAERIQLVPRFTRKLREVPLGLDWPHLVDDPRSCWLGLGICGVWRQLYRASGASRDRRFRR